MTIFDTLKYQISDPPTKEELTAIPVDLYGEWLISSGWEWSKTSPPPPSIVSMSYVGDPESPDIKLLRQMIRDYDDNL